MFELVQILTQSADRKQPASSSQCAGGLGIHWSAPLQRVPPTMWLHLAGKLANQRGGSASLPVRDEHLSWVCFPQWPIRTRRFRENLNQAQRDNEPSTASTGPFSAHPRMRESVISLARIGRMPINARSCPSPRNQASPCFSSRRNPPSRSRVLCIDRQATSSAWAKNL
jgi:hypothetical protein